MNIRSRFLVLLGTAIALAIPGLDVAGPPAGPQIISFDVPGAGTGSQQGTGCFGCTFAINQFGAIAGTYTDASGTIHGFLRSADGKSYTTIDAPTENILLGTWAQAINDWGEIAGYYVDLSFAPSGIVIQGHGFVRSPEGVFTTFDVFPGGGPSVVPLYLNDEGALAGWASDATFLAHLFLRRPDGTITAFLAPNECNTAEVAATCYGAEASYVNLLGATIGNFLDTNFVGHGLLRSPEGKLTTFDAPGAGNGGPFAGVIYQGTGCPGCATGSNIWGQIAGIYIDENYVYHTYLRSPDGRFYTEIAAPGAGTSLGQGTGCNSDCPVALNDLGVIAGSYVDSGFYHHGFVRTPDGTVVRIDPPTSEFTVAESINDSGTVVGYYNDQVTLTGINGVYHGFVVVNGW